MKVLRVHLSLLYGESLQSESRLNAQESSRFGLLLLALGQMDGNPKRFKKSEESEESEDEWIMN